MMKADIVFFSRTGNTKVVGEEIYRLLKRNLETRLIEIKPKKNYSYFFWLVLSFLPHYGVQITCEEVTSDFVFICFPKWTINCPPITTFLRKINLKEKNVFLVITFGGFDEKRYAEYYKNKVSKLCKEVKGVILIKRSEIKNGNLDTVRNWIPRLL